jgi:hypothetical protein
MQFRFNFIEILDNLNLFGSLGQVEIIFIFINYISSIFVNFEVFYYKLNK